MTIKTRINPFLMPFHDSGDTPLTAGVYEAHYRVPAASNTPMAPYQRLSMLPSNTILTKSDMMEIFGACDRSIRRWVMAHQLPPPVRVGRCNRIWLAGRVVAWLSAMAQAEESNVIEMVEKVKTLRK